MQHLNEILKNYDFLIVPLITFIVGWFLPTPFIKKLAGKVIDITPDKLEPLLINKLEIFVNSLKESSVNGDKNLTSNEKIDLEYHNLKTDLGLHSQSKKTPNGD